MFDVADGQTRDLLMSNMNQEVKASTLIYDR